MFAILALKNALMAGRNFLAAQHEKNYLLAIAVDIFRPPLD
jgi:hypothetical protein